MFEVAHPNPFIQNVLMLEEQDKPYDLDTLIAAARERLTTTGDKTEIFWIGLPDQDIQDVVGRTEGGLRHALLETATL